MISETEQNDDMWIKHHLVSGVYTKECHIKAGKVLTQHKHNFDHLSKLTEGTAIVECEGQRRILVAPAQCIIEANKNHKVTALTDIIWLCIHETDKLDISEIDDTDFIKGE